MEEKLNKEISDLEAQLLAKDLEIARLQGFIEGDENGFKRCKNIVITKLMSLPQIENNALSIQVFFSALAKTINEISSLKHENQ